MVWWPFATKPERADTSEVTDLHSGAPPLYSTVVDPSGRISTDVDASTDRWDTSTAVLRLIGYRVSRLRMNGTWIRSSL